MPWAESSTICARRQVTTDPESRRTVRNSRLPSSLVDPNTFGHHDTPEGKNRN